MTIQNHAFAQHVPGHHGDQHLATIYIELLKRALVNTIYEDQEIHEISMPRWKQRIIRKLLGNDAKVLTIERYDAARREGGLDWPAVAHTMVGVKRMDNLRDCILQVLADNIPGDIIETGVWRGGASIFAKGILKAFGDQSRRVWLADSFEGLPKPNPHDYPEDLGDIHHSYDYLRVGLDEVKQNFQKYDLLDERVCFVKGWFKDTLPTLEIEAISVLRLDGDMYESTIIALNSLYHKVSIGGFLIVDDYCIQSCARAVSDFRSRHGIDEPIQEIDGSGVYWRKSRALQSQT
jgi:O-methyltransferase